MNQSVHVSLQPHKQSLWASLECLMSIKQIDDRPVQSNYAMIQLADWSAEEICLRTPLKLPEHRHIMLEVEVVYEHISLSITGLLYGHSQVDRQFEYRMKHQLSSRDRAVLFHAMNRSGELSHWRWAEAIHSYRQMEMYDYLSPRLDFQT